MCARAVLTLVVVLVPCALACTPPLRLDEVTPQPAAPGAVVTVRGAGFTDDLDLELTSGGSKVSLQEITVEDQGEARATLPQATPAGTYELAATTSAGASATLDGVRVVPGGLHIEFVDIGQGDGTVV